MRTLEPKEAVPDANLQIIPEVAVGCFQEYRVGTRPIPFPEAIDAVGGPSSEEKGIAHGELLSIEWDIECELSRVYRHRAGFGAVTAPEAVFCDLLVEHAVPVRIHEPDDGSRKE